MRCTVCGKEFNGRADAKFCSASCRKKASRKKVDTTSTDERENSPISVIVEGPPVVEVVEESPEELIEMTKTDKLWEKDMPGYYRFDGELRELKCFECNQKFETRLTMAKVCSPKCKLNLLMRLTGAL